MLMFLSLFFRCPSTQDSTPDTGVKGFVRSAPYPAREQVGQVSWVFLEILLRMSPTITGREQVGQ